jgi:cytoskeletal protein RodZ
MPSLGNDLAAIRKSQGLTVKDIHESTKIPNNVLASIEDNSIFKGSGAGAPYIRGYVRSYAKALSIEEEKIVYALNSVKHGNYAGSLIDNDQRDDQEKPVADETDDKQQEPNPQQPDKQDDPTADKPNDTEAEEENAVLHSQEVDSVDWVDLGYQFQPAKTFKSKQRYIIIGFILLAITGFLVYWFYFKGTTSSAQNATQTGNLPQTTAAPDSLAEGVTPTASDDTVNMDEFSNTSQNQDALPDTLSIVLYAAYEKLEPVRVYTDITDQLNPYWIKRGEAIEFDFVNEFHIRNSLSDIALLMNGHVIPDFEEQFFNPETNRIEINRSFFQDNDKWLQPPPDTLQIKAPPPSVIHNPDN